MAVTPGWCAIRGWCAARSKQQPDSLGDWLPLATALGLTWTGILALVSGSTGLSLAANAGSGLRVMLWIGAAGVLWGLPFVVALAAGRLWPDVEDRTGDLVTVVMKDGSTIDGRWRRISLTHVTLEDCAMGELLGKEITVAREEIKIVVQAPHYALRLPDPTSDDPAPWKWPRPTTRRRVVQDRDAARHEIRV
ncbi:MAG: hypothetical protein M3320_04200 [Actinomycetota bacterium]|nr:hypothetical protein [Actinomycetota bacterium]MDQ5807855.1 hypothetical protein [Actinomycetota bacterium]